jgi:hypothetical protein
VKKGELVGACPDRVGEQPNQNVSMPRRRVVYRRAVEPEQPGVSQAEEAQGEQ